MQLGFFTGLKSLKRLKISEMSKIMSIEEIFDPSKINELEINKISANPEEFLRLFTNLRSFILYVGWEDDNLFFLPQMKALTSLRLNFPINSGS